jgi:group I intron endonuclease
LHHRMLDHFYRLKNNKHWGEQFQHDYNLFGKEAFETYVLEHCNDITEEQLFEKEQKWIDLLHPVYNINPLAGYFTIGRPISKNSIDKMRRALTGRKQTPEHIARRLATIAEKMKNGTLHYKSLTPEQKQHLSEINTGERNPNWGLHRSNETKRKQSESRGQCYVGAVSPTGEIFAPIHNMSKFCVEHGLCVSNMIALMHGRIRSSLGWKRLEPGKQEAAGGDKI